MNADPRRPEKVQRYVPKTNNGGGQEDLTPDYMNILGQHQTTANVPEAADKHSDPPEDVQPATDELAASTNATNVIPTSPQYGVHPPNDIPTETVTPPTETVTDTTTKTSDDNKELHSTPSRNDRFKVVKIASLEPFKRGRWKCMDYVDEAPPAGTTRAPQSAGSIQVSGGPYMQTQSLPQQQIQQMLMQSGFANGGQFFQPQMVPQGQYFYPQVANIQGQALPQQVPAQFIGGQAYFPATAGFSMPQAYPNVQYVPASLVQSQGGAFVPTSQTFQQSQTYAGQPNVSQAQPLVNGHAFTPQSEQQVAGSLPTQTAKSVILNAQPAASQTQLNHAPVQAQQFQQTTYQQPQTAAPAQTQPVQSQTFEQGGAYPAAQFPITATGLPVLDNVENAGEASEQGAGAGESSGETADDPAKTNPVVNAIDNKIEQAMDLVKSHLMYTVREEVEVLKEKIAELMERIQQLETENNFLRSQIPKSQASAAASTSSSTTTQAAAVVTNSGTGYVASSQTGTPVSNPSQINNPIPNAQGHSMPPGGDAATQ